MVKWGHWSKNNETGRDLHVGKSGPEEAYRCTEDKSVFWSGGNNIYDVSPNNCYLCSHWFALDIMNHLYIYMFALLHMQFLQSASLKSKELLNFWNFLNKAKLKNPSNYKTLKRCLRSDTKILCRLSDYNLKFYLLTIMKN